MNWESIARKDVRDATRSKSAWLLVGLFLVVFLGLVYAVSRLEGAEFDEFLGLAVDTVASLVPLIALVLGYKAVISERESGSVALLLSLPHSRADVLVGKFLGRSVVLVVPIVLATAFAGLAAVVLLGSVAPGRYLLFVGLTVLLGLAFLAIALGLSAGTPNQRRVTAGAFGVYLLFVVLWEDLVWVLVLVLFRFQFPVAPPDWSVFLELASPGIAFEFLGVEHLDVGGSVPVSGSGQQWFVTSWVALAILAAWIAVPLLVGYWRFRRSDL